MKLTDHYATLGLSPDSTADEIKAAFRHLAKQYHPDLTKDFGTSEQFRAVYIAYNILSDTGKRCHYDSLRQPSPVAPSPPPKAKEAFEQWTRDATQKGDQYAKMKYEDFITKAMRAAGRAAVSAGTWLAALLTYFGLLLFIGLPVSLFLGFVFFPLGIAVMIASCLPIFVCRSEDGTSFDPVKFWRIVGRVCGLRIE